MAVSPSIDNSETKTTASNRKRYLEILLFALIAVSVLAAWGGMLHGGFISDDWAWLERAQTGEVQRQGKFFRPACWLSWYAQSTADAGVAHGVDLLVHGLSSWQIGLLTWNLAGSFWAGSIAGVAIAILPTLHEAVCWSSARCGIVVVFLVVVAMQLVLWARGSRAIPVLFLAVALLFKEPALALMWGLPLLLFCQRRSGEAVRWSFVLLGLMLAYAAAAWGFGAHAKLSGGYAVPFEIGRTVHHIGAYLGLLVGIENTDFAWPLWGLVGFVMAAAAVRHKRLGIFLWLWMSLIMVPFVRLGGPEQLRFLYPLSICPIVGGSVVLATLVRRNTRRQIVALILLGTAAVFLISEAREASCDWVEAGQRSVRIVERTAERMPARSTSILVNPPEWHGRAHLFRNGLFQALRITSGNSLLRGVSIPPSFRIQRAGELAAWLGTHHPDLLADETVGAWLYVDDSPVRLKGWRAPEHASRLLEDCIEENEYSAR